MSDSLRPRESQHARPPCQSPTPGVHSNSRPSSRWCHPAISSSVIPFSSCPQSLPTSESFPVSQLFASGGQGIELHHQSFQWIFRVWVPWGLTGLISCWPRNSQEKALNEKQWSVDIRPPLLLPRSNHAKCLSCPFWVFISIMLSLWIRGLQCTFVSKYEFTTVSS